MDDNETRSFGYCEECGNEVTEKHYVTEDGKVLCCIECVLEHQHVHVVEV